MALDILINIPFGILGIMLSLKFMPNIKNDTASNDYAGLVMVSLSFIFITLSLEVIDENNNWLFSFLLFFAGIFSIVMYVIYAKKIHIVKTINLFLNYFYLQ